MAADDNAKPCAYLAVMVGQSPPPVVLIGLFIGFIFYAYGKGIIALASPRKVWKPPPYKNLSWHSSEGSSRLGRTSLCTIILSRLPYLYYFPSILKRETCECLPDSSDDCPIPNLRIVVIVQQYPLHKSLSVKDPSSPSWLSFLSPPPPIYLRHLASTE